jgi:protein phosphatase
MENDAATFYCPNELCQAANPLTNKFCQQCSTPIPKRYLWVVGDKLSVSNPGELIAARYLVISHSLVLDTKPGLAPQTPELDSFEQIRPYLRLFPYRLHVPQIYGILPSAERSQEQEILLLEKPPLKLDNISHQAELASKLTAVWSEATSSRQLNWLWQIAYLWQPLTSEGVASSLLEPELLRTEGQLVRLLELRTDMHRSPTLFQLGECWQQWFLSGAKPAIAEFLQDICSSLIKGEIHSSEQLVAILDRGLAEVGREQTHTIKIATKSDTGPSRQRNEDACYPPSGTSITKPPSPTALAIVCDGIGGHEGGNVASNLAIESIIQQLQDITRSRYDYIDPNVVLGDLEQAAAVANDKISQRNDNEHRQGRQRMGTTLVMALPLAHEMYVAHVGDSRAYWITRQGCYQVTLDDDVASREVRLGYAIYRDVVQQGASGSLVQALGMNASSSLHPTAQRFILDEDCVFLLCSDGLSDFDRVEQYWETEVLPIITDKLDVMKATEKLVEIANHQNGHDNVTIAILHYQVKYSEPKSSFKPAFDDLYSEPASNSMSTVVQGTQFNSTTQKTQVISTLQPAKTNRTTRVPLQLIIVSALVMVTGTVAFLLSKVGFLNDFSWKNSPAVPSPIITENPSVNNLELKKGTVIRTTNEIVLKTLPRPEGKEFSAPQGSDLQIITEIPNEANSESWVGVRLCDNKAGEEAWILQSQLTSSNFDELKDDSQTPCSIQKVSPSPTTAQPKGTSN